MKIEFISPTKELYKERDYQSFYKVIVNGKKFMYFRDGEPEDATLNRDFNDVYCIEGLIRDVIKAVKNGEEIILEDREISEE